MLDKDGRKRRDLITITVACAICSTLLVLMLIVAYADLLVVSTDHYLELGSDLSKCQARNSFLEGQIYDKDVRVNWDEINKDDWE